MTDDELDAALAKLGLDRRWRELGVIDARWLTPRPHSPLVRPAALPPGGEPRSSTYERLGQARFSYLHRRDALDDATLLALLDVAATVGEPVARRLARWPGATPAQRAMIERHPAVGRLMRQRQRLQAFQAGAPVPASVVGFASFDPVDPDLGDPGVFVVCAPGFSPQFAYRIAWEHPLSARDAHAIGALVAALPHDVPARCHTPVLGLRLDPGGTAEHPGPDGETRLSFCFLCSNIYVDNGDTRSFDTASAPAQALLAALKQHAPPTWRLDEPSDDD